MSYKYDEINRLKTLNNLDIKSYTYDYDNNSNILGNWLDTYSYDNLNQIIDASYAIKLVNKETNSYTYDQMWNREIETQTRTNDNGRLINKTLNYSTNNLNQYTDKVIYNPNNEEIVDEIIQEVETPIETWTWIIEVIDVEILTWSELETTQEIIEPEIQTEELVELNWKLIYDKNWNMIWNMLNNKRKLFLWWVK